MSDTPLFINTSLFAIADKLVFVCFGCYLVRGYNIKMANQKIIKSIKLQLQKGFEEGAIKSNLVVEGYQESDIDDAFNNLDTLETEPEKFIDNTHQKEEIVPEEPIKSENIPESTPSKTKFHLPKNLNKKLFKIIALNLIVLLIAGAVWAYYTYFR